MSGGQGPVIVEHGTHLEITWPDGRGREFPCTPELVEGWVKQMNALRAHRDRLAEAFTSLLAEFGQDVDNDRTLDTWSAQLTRAEMANLHMLSARGGQ